MAKQARSVFISFAEEDVQYASILADELEKRGIGAWIYVRDNAYGNLVDSEIIKALKACDHFLVVLSLTSTISEWVSRELGFVLHRRERRKESYPNIVGIRIGPELEKCVLNVRDFYSGELIGEHDFNLIRCFNIKPETADSFDDLAKHLHPTVTHIEDDEDPDQIELLERSFDCYEELFTDEGERDTSDDIQKWLELVSVNRGNKDYPWVDIWSVLHIKEYPIGISFLTIHKGYSLGFGNYLAVRPDFRQNNRARKFLEDVIEHARETQPHIKGILFEVDPVNFDLLNEVSSFLVDNEHKYKVPKDVTMSSKAFFNWLDGVLEELTGRGHYSREDVIKNIRFLRRLWLYDHHPDTYIVVDGEGKPLPYWQPAMSEPLDATNERPLYFMVHLFKDYTKKDIDLFEVANFIYDDFYGSAYGDKNSNTYIEGFEDYLPKVKERFVAQLSQGWDLGKVPRKGIRMLERVLKNVAPEKIAL
jgi:hypothetical protein